MDEFEEQLAEAVRKHSHLYNCSNQTYKDIQMAKNSWMEIAQLLCTEETVCRKRWRALRDKFAKAKRRVQKRTSRRPYGKKSVPELYTALQWLDVYVKNRAPTSDTSASQAEAHAEEKVSQLCKREQISSLLSEYKSCVYVEPQTERSLKDTEKVAGAAVDLKKEPDNKQKEQFDSLPVITTSFSLADSSLSSYQTIGASLKRKRQATTQTEKSSADHLGSLRDEDELFLLSLLPSIKRLTFKKRMEVRMKFQQVLYAAEFEK
ncbi:uncharacterized protein LOC108237339 [Kryptolebias marmoratus]|uniref:uncharacterized protein LOC108237339 n=1 Tax=Kryptolebias marmoratus TaxID=37003 RepID=UPI0007F8C9AF|nr:uncharacterized protein LOC108237339 [Kryptolebias marmoratus]